MHSFVIAFQHRGIPADTHYRNQQVLPRKSRHRCLTAGSSIEASAEFVLLLEQHEYWCWRDQTTTYSEFKGKCELMVDEDFNLVGFVRLRGLPQADDFHSGVVELEVLD
jgi:hypothetical protein